MHALSIPALALALTAPLVHAAPVSIFYVKNFHTLCTDTYPQHSCTTSFNVTYQDSPSYHCDLDGSERGYVFCQNPGPGISMAAFIQEAEDDQRTLKLRYEVATPTSAAHDTFGEQVLTETQGSEFGVVVNEQT